MRKGEHPGILTKGLFYNELLTLCEERSLQQKGTDYYRHLLSPATIDTKNNCLETNTPYDAIRKRYEVLQFIVLEL